MINIPTELLRTLIAVVDLRSFTKAAQSLGITQPAVSAQIKRLQVLLGSDLLDKSAPGVSLTSAGELVVQHARRLLSINDQILDLSSPQAATQPLRIGMTGDFAAGALSRAFIELRASQPDIRFAFRSGGFDMLLRSLRESDLDVVVAVAVEGATIPPWYDWTEKLVWVKGGALTLPPNSPIPLVSFGDECSFYRAGIAALTQAGTPAELVLSASSMAPLCAAVAAGLGVMVLPQSRADCPGLAICEDPRLPELPEISCGIFVREGSGRELREQAARTIRSALSQSAPALLCTYAPAQKVGAANSAA
jgi:DNA-binding transcriptional LysR family regulator